MRDATRLRTLQTLFVAVLVHYVYRVAYSACVEVFLGQAWFMFFEHITAAFDTGFPLFYITRAAFALLLRIVWRLQSRMVRRVRVLLRRVRFLRA